MIAFLNGNDVERRKVARISLAYPVRIGLLGGAQKLCQIRNISKYGAGLLTDSKEPLPDTFDLLLSYDSEGKRACRKVWQIEHSVGVEFLQIANGGPGVHAI